jgi:hypothetical protein
MRERLPPPLPPAERTVGQLVAETIRFYQAHFWRVLPLGLAIAALNQVGHGFGARGQVLLVLAAAPLVTAAYVAAASLVLGRPPTWVAFAAGVVIWLPVPVLILVFILPAVAWLALVGLAVPAAVAEPLSFRAALARGYGLGRADFVHAWGSLAALVIVFFVSRQVLVILLHGQADNTVRVAVFLADLVLAPLMLVGGAMLYHDQAARVGSAPPDRRSRRHADLHPPVEADAAGRADAPVEP